MKMLCEEQDGESREGCDEEDRKEGKDDAVRMGMQPEFADAPPGTCFRL